MTTAKPTRPRPDQAELEAIYAGRPFSRLPRDHIHNSIQNMIEAFYR